MSSKRSKSLSNSRKRFCSSEVIRANFNEMYEEILTKSQLLKSWQSSEKIQLDNGIEFDTEPFPHLLLPNFLSNQSHLESLTEELHSLEFHEKNNDLFNFKQSRDLKDVNKPSIKAFRDLMFHDFHTWLKDATGTPLFNEVSMSCSQYNYTDVLLCHDDELEGRRIAFILYLVPYNWTKDDGGTLDLFSKDGNGQPDKIQKSITPVRNQLILFEVTPISFHQVSEVFSESKTRITIGGWFHGPGVERPPPYVEPSPVLVSPKYIEEKRVYSWINPSYIDMATQKEIRTQFRESSEIELEKFINFEKYNEICEVLKNMEIKWKTVGPVNRRCYELCGMDALPEIIGEFVKLMQSEAMFLILSSLTGLKFHELASFSDSDSEDDGDDPPKSRNSTCFAEISRWGHQNYTLVRDNDFNSNKSCLNALMYFNCADWTQDMGGFMSYIAKEDEEELLTVNPRQNTLALVYKDEATHSFVKYVNHQMKYKDKFCSLMLTYFE